MQLFHFWSRDVHPVQNLLLCVYKFLWKSDDFPLRYGDITIFKMAAVRHLGIVLLTYETSQTTREVCCWRQLPVKLFSCQSDAQIWRYSYLNFSHIWLEMSIQAPKMGVLEDLHSMWSRTPQRKWNTTLETVRFISSDVSQLVTPAATCIVTWSLCHCLRV